MYKPKVTLSSHVIKVSKKHSSRKEGEEKFEELDIIGGTKLSSGKDMYVELKKYLKIDQKYHDEEHKKLASISNLECNDSERWLYGQITYGEYGYAAEIEEATDENADPNQMVQKRIKSKDDALMMPYYFLFYIPKEDIQAYIILQRFQKYGIQTVIKSVLRGFFDQIFSEYRYDFENLFTASLLREVLEGASIRELNFTTLRPDICSDDLLDYADSVGTEPMTDTKTLTVETSIKVAGETVSGKKLKRQIIDSKIDWTTMGPGLLTEYGVDQNAKEVNIVIDEDDSTRTIKLFKSGVHLTFNNQLFPYFDITSDVDFESETNHPKYKSVHQVSQTHLKTLLEELDPYAEHMGVE